MRVCPVCLSPYPLLLGETLPAPISIMSVCTDPEQSHRLHKERCELHFCPSCLHVFNAAFEESFVDYDNEGCRMFNNGEAWRQHIKDLQTYISKRQYDTIVEIGPGDGSFLAGCEAKTKIVYEPSDDYAKCEALGFITYHEYYDPFIHTEGGKTLVLMRHVLEHFANPALFLESVTSAFKAAPVEMIVEVPNVMNAITNRRVEDWVYEHAQHFTPFSMAALFKRCGWVLIRNETKYNGEIIVAHAHRKFTTGEVLMTQALENFCTFSEDIRKARLYLAGLTQERKKVAFWGGIGKSAVFLNQFYQPGMHVVDSDPNKIGLCVPGLDVRIESPDVLRQFPAHTLVITTSWRADDIMADARRRGIRCEQTLIYKNGRLIEYGKA